MKNINIQIPGNSYPVLIGREAFSALLPLIEKRKLYRNLFLLVDQNVFKYHKKAIEKFTKSYKGKLSIHLYNVSEKNKTYAAVQKIHSDLIKNGFGRDTTLVAVGGGITGDVGGFAASTFTRGINFVQVPTTLLSAVDSSVGGKTGINFGGTKNIIGTFYQPGFVLVDLNFLNTLSRSDIVCGAGEILKYGLMTDEKVFYDLLDNYEKLINLNEKYIQNILELCIEFKGGVVAEDEKESGLRKVLNLGHTFAHAIEVEQNHRIKHGQAVAVGLAAAIELSSRLNLIDSIDKDELMQLPLLLKDEIRIKNYSAAKIYEAMKRDKKGRDQKIKFVLIGGLGKIILDVEAEKKDVINSISYAVKLFGK
jgi:3-dehydroquinate synthase